MNKIKIYSDSDVLFYLQAKEVEESDEREKWIKIKDLLKLIDDRIKFLEGNEWYPAYGLNSQVQALQDLKSSFEDVR